jgi:hypothetical protein
MLWEGEEEPVGPIAIALKPLVTPLINDLKSQVKMVAEDGSHAVVLPDVSFSGWRLPKGDNLSIDEFSLVGVQVCDIATFMVTARLSAPHNAHGASMQMSLAAITFTAGILGASTCMRPDSQSAYVLLHHSPKGSGDVKNWVKVRVCVGDGFSCAKTCFDAQLYCADV